MERWIENITSGTATAASLEPIFPWAKAMIGCPHDPVYHAEGDPWVHTALVAQALETAEGFSDLPEERKEILRLTAWLHDIAKPNTTEVGWCDKEERERVRQPGHAPLGASMAYHALIDAGYDQLRARDVHALVFWHQRPSHLIEQKNALKRIVQFSHDVCVVNWSDLLRFCHADQRGRTCASVQNAIDNLHLTEQFISEEGINIGCDLLREPWHFGNNEARMKFLRGEEASAYFTPMPAHGSRVLMMSGLPGSGKNTCIARHFAHLPVVSLDDLREEMGVSATDNQGGVRQAAFEAARVHLRKGEDFIWNATCLTRLMRQKIVGLVMDYHGTIEAHAIDVPLAIAQKRNQGRPEPVPAKIIEKLAGKREPILTDEAHSLFVYGADLAPRQVFGTRPDQSPAPSP